MTVNRQSESIEEVEADIDEMQKDMEELTVEESGALASAGLSAIRVRLKELLSDLEQLEHSR